jgi:hypothetical protein
MTRTIVCGLALAVALGGCSGGVSGLYKAKGNAAYESLDFKGDTVSIVVMKGVGGEGKVTVDGDKLTVVDTDGRSVIFTKDKDGCLTNELVGTYCK